MLLTVSQTPPENEYWLLKNFVLIPLFSGQCSLPSCPVAMATRLDGSDWRGVIFWLPVCYVFLQFHSGKCRCVITPQTRAIMFWEITVRVRHHLSIHVIYVAANHDRELNVIPHCIWIFTKEHLFVRYMYHSLMAKS